METQNNNLVTSNDNSRHIKHHLHDCMTVIIFFFFLFFILDCDRGLQKILYVIVKNLQEYCVLGSINNEGSMGRFNDNSHHSEQ